MKYLISAILVMAVTFVSGCHPHRHHRVVNNGHPEYVVVRGHVHDDRCGHYQYRGRWLYHAGHHHGHGCGHHFRKGIWILAD